MASDIRLEVGLRDNLKRKKLQRKLGAEAVLALIDFWMYCGVNNPSGDITGMTAEDIACAANYVGDAEKFMEILITEKWIDIDKNGRMQIHEWDIHQPFVYNGAKISKRNSKNARKGHENKRKLVTKSQCESHCENEKSHCENTKAQCESHNTNQPTYLPTKSTNQPTYQEHQPTNKKQKNKDMSSAVADCSAGLPAEPEAHCANRVTKADCQKLADVWNECTAGILPRIIQLTPEREKHAKARLHDNSDLKYWRDIFLRMAASPWCQGRQNRDGPHINWKADFEFALRPGTHVKVLEGGYGCIPPKEAVAAAEKVKVRAPPPTPEQCEQAVQKVENKYSKGYACYLHMKYNCPYYGDEICLLAAKLLAEKIEEVEK